MVRRQFSLIAFLAALTLRLAAASAAMPDYNLGDTATADVVSPMHLIVIDHDRTAKLRREEAQRTPPIFRFYPGVVEVAEASLRSAFTATRERFFVLLEGSYSKRALNESAVT